jgi:hypothetical protein
MIDTIYGLQKRKYGQLKRITHKNIKKVSDESPGIRQKIGNAFHLFFNSLLN